MSNARRPTSTIRTLSLAGLLAGAALLPSGTAHAQQARWCDGVRIRFFVGGAEGDPFGAVVHNGARQAALDTGASVEFVFSGWDEARMVQQLREAIAARPAGIAMMGHPGDAAVMPLAGEAARAGIRMMYQNVPLPKVVAAYGGGYVGAVQEAQGRALGREAIRAGGLRPGDTAFVLGPFHNEGRGARERGTAAALREGGIEVVEFDAPVEWASDPNLALPVITAAVLAHPDVKAIAYPGAQILGNVAVYMRAIGRKPGEIFNFGFDASPEVVEGIKDGWIQVAADQQPFQQGYLPVLSLCQQIVLGLSPISFDTSAGFVTAENIALIETLAKEAIR
jgi:simple sugar transport system substrate-binding protein